MLQGNLYLKQTTTSRKSLQGACLLKAHREEKDGIHRRRWVELWEHTIFSLTLNPCRYLYMYWDLSPGNAPTRQVLQLGATSLIQYKSLVCASVKHARHTQHWRVTSYRILELTFSAGNAAPIVLLFCFCITKVNHAKHTGGQSERYTWLNQYQCPDSI